MKLGLTSAHQQKWNTFYYFNMHFFPCVSIYTQYILLHFLILEKMRPDFPGHKHSHLTPVMSFEARGSKTAIKRLLAHLPAQTLDFILSNNFM